MRLLKLKQRQKEKAIHIEDTQTFATEIKMLKVYYIGWQAEEKIIPSPLPLSVQSSLESHYRI
jgi:hypothetical protein